MEGLKVLLHLCSFRNSSRYSLSGIVDHLDGHMPAILLKGEGAYEVLVRGILRCMAMVVECIRKVADIESTSSVDLNTTGCGILGFHILAAATELQCKMYSHILKPSRRRIHHDNHSQFQMEHFMLISRIEHITTSRQFKIKTVWVCQSAEV